MTVEPKLYQVNRSRDSLALCTQCGYCTFWCPLYQEKPEESAVARGKLRMLREVLAGEREFNDDCALQINQCLLCGTCFEHCPEKTPTPEVIVASRADKVRAKGVKFPYNIVYRQLMPHRTIFGNVVRVTSWLQDIFAPRTEGTIRHLAFFLSALGKGRHIPSIAPRFLRQTVPKLNRPPVGTTTRMRVGYFIGCMTDFVFPHVGKNVVEFLTQQGVEVMVPRKQGCCGAPVYLGAGDLETGRRLADTNVNALEGVDYVISSCATCTSAMKDYAKFLANAPEREEAYIQFAAKLKDVSEFLVDVLQLPASAYHVVPEVVGKKVTWHDSCHLNRYLGIRKQPRQILKLLPGIEFTEMVRSDWCCGMAGAFSLNYYELSSKIADRKMDTIRESGADIVVTGCPGCQIQLMDNAIRRKVPVKVMHVMELLE